MISISRFRVPDAAAGAFHARADAVVAFWRERPGCEEAQVVRNHDEPDLWAIVTRWADVGSYRRSFNGFEAKVILMTLLSEAIDEPSAYAAPDVVGVNRPRGV